MGDFASVRTIRDLADFLDAQEYGVESILDCEFASLKTESPDEGCVLFCKQRAGNKRDYNAQLSLARSARRVGALAIVAEEPLYAADGSVIPSLIVNDVNAALARICSESIALKGITKVSVVGSLTTESTTALLAAASGDDHACDISCGRELLESVTSRLASGVAINAVPLDIPGGVETLAGSASSQICVITDLASNHIGDYESVEQAIGEINKAVSFMGSNSFVVVNADDTLLAGIDLPSTAVRIGSNSDAAVRIMGTKQTPAGLRVEILDNVTEDVPVNVTLEAPVFGKGKAFSIAAAYTVARLLGESDEAVKARLVQAKLTPVNSGKLTVNGFDLFVDVWGVSCQSIAADLEALEELKCEGRRIAVIGIKSLVNAEDEEDFAAMAEAVSSASIDQLIGFGEAMKSLCADLWSVGRTDVLYFDGPDLLAMYLATLRNDDAVLIAADVEDAVALAVDQAFGTDLFVNGKVFRDKYARSVVSAGVTYSLLACGRSKAASVDFVGSNGRSVYIPNSVGSYSVEYVNDASFAGKQLYSAYFGDNVTGVGDGAFKGCKNLRSVGLNEGLKSIGPCAFEGCESLRAIDIPDSVISIGPRSFAGCSKLETVVLPKGAISIAEDAFEGCPYKGFTAQQSMGGDALE